jgi:hypothetical protein
MFDIDNEYSIKDDINHHIGQAAIAAKAKDVDVFREHIQRAHVMSLHLDSPTAKQNLQEVLDLLNSGDVTAAYCKVQTYWLIGEAYANINH